MPVQANQFRSLSECFCSAVCSSCWRRGAFQLSTGNPARLADSRPLDDCFGDNRGRHFNLSDDALFASRGAGNVVETKMNVPIRRHFRQIVEMPTSDAAFSFVFYESAALFEDFFKVFFSSFGGLRRLE
jgi:hypothetical protein